jgi:hypothetical protein
MYEAGEILDVVFPSGEVTLHPSRGQESRVAYGPAISYCRCWTQSLLRQRVDTVRAPGSGLPISCQAKRVAM